MTTRYYDSVSGNDANDGLTPATAKALYTSVGTVAGDTFLFKRGTTQTFPSMVTARTGTSDAVRTRYGVYGESSTNYVTFVVTSGSIIMNAAFTKYCTFEDIKFDMQGTAANSLYCASQSVGGQTIGNIIRRCIFTRSTASGLSIVREASSTAAGPTGYVIEDCEFFDNDEHGLFILGGSNIVVRRCKFYRNGLNEPTGGHGFSARANHTTATSGWTVTADPSGKIWQRTLGAVELDVYYVKTSVTVYQKLRRTAGSQTAPAAGEFGVSGTTLYINADSTSDPSGQSVVYVWDKCSGLIVEDCESYENYWNRAAPFHEGHGYAFDDWSDDSIFRRNLAYNNEGCGFSINRGDRNQVIGNIAYGNWQAGVVCNPTDGTIILNNTFYGNNADAGSVNTGEIHSWGYSRDAVISNNILVSTVAYGISRETTDTGFSGVTNNISGYLTAAEKNAAVTGTVLVAPQLDGNHRPQAAACRRAGTYLGGKAFGGKHFYDPPNIGAMDDVTATARPLIASLRPR